MKQWIVKLQLVLQTVFLLIIDYYVEESTEKAN